MFFLFKDVGPTIEEFISSEKDLYGKKWKNLVWLGLEDEAAKWFISLASDKLYKLLDEEFEKVFLDFLDKWSHARKQDKDKHMGLFPTAISLL